MAKHDGEPLGVLGNAAVAYVLFSLTAPQWASVTIALSVVGLAWLEQPRKAR